MTKTKTNVIIGVLIGALAGLVFGMALLSPEIMTESTGKTKGNVSVLSHLRHTDNSGEKSESEIRNDSLKYTVTDEQGESWNVIMTKIK